MATSRLIPQGIPTITEFYFDGSGTLLKKNGTSKFKAQANYTNMIIVYMEDGNTNQEINLINFSPKNTNRTYTSHWLYLAYAGVKEHIIQGEINPRVFTAYYIIVPNLVLQNNKVDGVIENDITIVKRYGVDNKGTFNTFDDLINTITPNQELMENNAFAYVLTGDGYGFYQVGLDINSNTYVWELRDNVMNYGLEQKPMEVQTIYIQKGYANVQNLPDINTTTIQMLMQILNSLSIKVDSVLGAILNANGLETNSAIVGVMKQGQELFIDANVKISQDNKNIKVKEDGLLVDVYTDLEIDEKFKDVSDRIDLIDGEGGRLDEIEGDILGIKTDIDLDIKPRLTNVENLASNNKARLDDVDLEITRIDEKDTQQDLRLDNVETKANKNESDIVNLDIKKADKTTLEKYATILLVNELIKQHNDDINSHKYILSIIASLQKGGSKPLVFNNTLQLEEWINDGDITHEGYLPSDLVVGQMLLTIPEDELDYWVAYVPVNNIDELISMHSKVDLSSYAKLTDLNAMETTIKEWVNDNFYDKLENDALLNNKVDKVSGKGLSTNDFTNALKTKLDGLDTQTELDNKFEEKANNTDLAQLYGGKNIGPDLTGKEYLGNGVYRIYNEFGITADYDVYNGVWTLNGESTATTAVFIVNLQPNTDYTISNYIVNNSSITYRTYLDNTFITQKTLNDTDYQTFNENSNNIRIFIREDNVFDDVKVKVQIEKDSVATPYTLPMYVTPEYIRQTKTPRLIYSNYGTSSGTDITFSYVDNTMKVGDVYKVHSQLTYNNSELTQREVNDLIISDTVNNNIEKNHYAQTQHSAITKINYNYTTKTITMIGDFNAGDSSNSFNIRLYKVGY